MKIKITDKILTTRGDHLCEECRIDHPPGSRMHYYSEAEVIRGEVFPKITIYTCLSCYEDRNGEDTSNHCLPLTKKDKDLIDRYLLHSEDVIYMLGLPAAKILLDASVAMTQIGYTSQVRLLRRLEARGYLK